MLRVSAPDRETGALVDIPVPPGFLGPKFTQLLSAPLNVQFDNFWNVAIGANGKTVRATACDGIQAKVAAQIAQRGDRAHDVSCDLATNGEILVQQIGSTLMLAYLLRNNSVTFQSTSTQTCDPNNGSVFCPNDPRFTVKFAIEILTAERLRHMRVVWSDGQVFIQGASFEPHNASAEMARFLFPDKFIAGEAAINETVRPQPLPIDVAFKELRDGDLCTKRLPGADRILFAFRDFEMEIDMRRGIVLHATHAGILPPGVSVTQATPASRQRAIVLQAHDLDRTAADQGRRHGSAARTAFSGAINLSTELPVSLEHDNRNPSVILGAAPGGVCFNGGGTDLEFGPVGGACAPTAWRRLRQARVRRESSRSH